jgi:hypothetical protein
MTTPDLLAPLTELKAKLGIRTSAHDGELVLYLEAASNVARRYGPIPDPIPAEVRLAVLIIAQHLWETERGTGSRTDLGARGPEDGEAAALSGFAVPRRAEQLLGSLRGARLAPRGVFPLAAAWPVA